MKSEPNCFSMLSHSTKSSQHTAQDLFQSWKELPKKEQMAFLGHLLKRKRLREDLEDLIDIAICEERSKEPVRPLEDILKARKRKDIYR